MSADTKKMAPVIKLMGLSRAPPTKTWPVVQAPAKRAPKPNKNPASNNHNPFAEGVLGKMAS